MIQMWGGGRATCLLLRSEWALVSPTWACLHSEVGSHYTVLGRPSFCKCYHLFRQQLCSGRVRHGNKMNVYVLFATHTGGGEVGQDHAQYTNAESANILPQCLQCTSWSCHSQSVSPSNRLISTTKVIWMIFSPNSTQTPSNPANCGY